MKDFNPEDCRDNGYFYRGLTYHYKWTVQDRDLNDLTSHEPPQPERTLYRVTLGDLIRNREPWRTQLPSRSPGLPRNTPWIFNTAVLQVEGKELSLRWGPNYADPIRGVYVDIMLGGQSIWSSDPHMRRKLNRRLRDPSRIVIDNYAEPLRIRDTGYCRSDTAEHFYPDGPRTVPPPCNEPKMLHSRWGRYGSRTVELTLEGVSNDPEAVTHSTLWASTHVGQGAGEKWNRTIHNILVLQSDLWRELGEPEKDSAYRLHEEEVVIRCLKEMDYRPEYPRLHSDAQPVQDRWEIMLWVWAWKGLDSTLEHKSAILTKLLEGRVTQRWARAHRARR